MYVRSITLPPELPRSTEKAKQSDNLCKCTGEQAKESRINADLTSLGRDRRYIEDRKEKYNEERKTL